MRNILLIFLALGLFACNNADVSEPAASTSTSATPTAPEYAMVIHGGAGTILPENMTDERAASIR